MLRSSFILICLTSLSLFNCEERSSPKPNIVLILSDDQAWNDYGFMGHDFIRTPNLDHLASESVVFNRGYVPTAICRPSLMTLITGLYPHQHKITGNDPLGGFSEPKFPREELLVNIDTTPTLPKILSKNGYLSFQSGKWWEGHFKRGGFTHGMTEGRRHGDYGLSIGRDGMQPIYDFIDSTTSKNKPFFLWYAPFLPHLPHNAPKRFLDNYSDMGLDSSTVKYYATVEWFDETVGQLVNYLNDRGLRDNTLIYYVCDNGWIQRPNKEAFDFGSKQTPMEAGVRTPIMLSWPGKIKPNNRKEYITSVDLYPTILNIAGIDPPGDLPGINLWDNLTTGQPIKREIIFGEGYGHDIIDKGNPEASLAYLWCIENNWKLILCYDGQIEGWGEHTHQHMREEPIRLYNVFEDPFEKTNLASQLPEKVNELKAKIESWYPLSERQLFTN